MKKQNTIEATVSPSYSKEDGKLIVIEEGSIDSPLVNITSARSLKKQSSHAKHSSNIKTSMCEEVTGRLNELSVDSKASEDTEKASPVGYGKRKFGGSYQKRFLPQCVFFGEKSPTPSENSELMTPSRYENLAGLNSDLHTGTDGK